MRTPLVAFLLLAPALAGCSGSDFEWPEPQAHACDAAAGSGMACETVWEGFEKPVHVLSADDGTGDLYILTQPGRIWKLEDGNVSTTPWLDLRDRVATCHLEQGLLGLAFPDDFEESGTFYASYTEKKSCSKRGTYGKGDLIVSRFEARDGEARRGSEERILRVPEPYRNHNGGHLLFGPDGMLYIGVGDGGDHGDPLRTGQDPDDLLGSILRIDVSGARGYTVPADNPFVDGGGRPEVWMYGLRNPWRFWFEGEEAVWVADVGQSCFEEINRIPLDAAPGSNLGWSAREGAAPYQTGSCPAASPAGTGLVDPLHTYDHTQGDCSVTGGFIPRPDALPAAEGGYIFSDFCTGRLWALWEEDGTVRIEHLMDTGLQVTSIGEDDDGNVYLTHWAGSLHRLVPATDSSEDDATTQGTAERTSS